MHIALLSSLAALALTPTMATAQDLAPGAWKQKIVFELFDDQSGTYKKLSEAETTACFTREALARPPLNTSKIIQQGGTCSTPQRPESEPGTSVWTASCKTFDGKEMEMMSRLSGTSLRYEATVATSTRYRGEVVKGRAKVVAEHLGTCAPDMVMFR